MTARLWHAAQAFLLSLGAKHHVNPWVFGAIYVGAVPFFSASVAWLVRSARRKQPTLLPLLSTGFFFVSAYLYLIAVGRDVPVWVYVATAAIVLGGGAGAVRKVRRQLRGK